MKRLQQHYKNIITQDLLLKGEYKNFLLIPKITKITLNIGLVDSFVNKKKIISLILLLELISGKKSFITKSKKNKITLKIKKGSVVGCKTTLRKRLLFNFLEKIFIFQLPFIKDFKGFIWNDSNKNVLNFKISNMLNHLELEEEFLKFQKIPPVNMTIHLNSKKNEESISLLNLFNIPLMQ